ncbi:tRNA lysidine(34) synthetase TilS [Idiomarina sp. Sol25]|uniref:tRNA lysidine(34) synthetase TilS n=1 Tax=Idiomarina sp. Sol25 TaxID=3064000 RepID=UPI00294B99D9|nr:tRNA lysidine(34) synthetase TilS [Idiomarina sp. Sol25]MDV6328776.1 tRNA lysidine(34) synthetase TilS [Idiomarina sp. Sol25]
MMKDGLYDLFCESLESLALKPGQQLVAALGGGADSQTILDLLMRFRQHNPQYQYLAIHLDHSFHPSSADWSSTIEHAAKAYGVKTVFEPLNVPVENRQSKEAAGRESRYRRMAELTDDDAVLLLGQHRNDQIETFFLQLKRGSGPKGLSSMAVVQPLRINRRLCRPLLSVSKEDILSYARQHKLTWIEDDTNYDTRIERNFLRHKVVPLLEQRWPQFGHSVLRSAKLCAEQQQVMDELLLEKLHKAQKHKSHFPLSLLSDHSAAMQRALLRAWLQKLKYSLPSYEQLEQIRLQAQSATDDSQMQVQCDGYSVRYFQYALWCDNNVGQLPEDCWLAEANVDLGEWGKLSVPDALLTNSNELRLTFLLSSEKLAKPGRHGRKKLKDWLKQAGIPPWLRARRPILELNAQYVWVAELGWFSYQVIEKTEFESLQLPEPDWVSSGADSYRQL